MLAVLPECASAQTTYTVEGSDTTYAIPVKSTLKVDSTGVFRFTYYKKDYDFPLSSVIRLTNDETYLPLALRFNQWWGGYSGAQSNSNSILGTRKGKFYWGDTSVSFSEYSCSGTVVDTVANVIMPESSPHHEGFGNTVDLIYYKDSNGKYGALVLSYGKDPVTGHRLNNAVGVDRWFSQLDSCKGVSGKEYQFTGAFSLFDDLDTAKDITLNMSNFAMSDINGKRIGSLTYPTWNYLCDNTVYKSRILHSDTTLAKYKIPYNSMQGRKKPTQSDLDDAYGWRFESPDTTNVIVDYYYTAVDSTGIQFPELKTGSGDTDADPKKITENYTWMGNTCVYLVPFNGTGYSKYRKFKGYIHVKMIDGSEYRQYFAIPKNKGYIEADSIWEKTKDASLKILAQSEDNGEFHYANTRFVVSPNIVGSTYGSRMKTLKEVYEYEHSLDNAKNVQLVPVLDTYVPLSFANVVPHNEMHYNNFSFMPENPAFMSSKIQKQGVLLHMAVESDAYSKNYSPGYNSWMYTDERGRIVAYSTDDMGGVTAIEWYQ